MIMIRFKSSRVARSICVNVNNVNYTRLSRLFSGGFAFVYEAQDMSSGKDYALKVRSRCTHTANKWSMNECTES